MSNRSLVIAAVVPFLLLCAIGLYFLTGGEERVTLAVVDDPGPAPQPPFVPSPPRHRSSPPEGPAPAPPEEAPLPRVAVDEGLPEPAKPRGSLRSQVGLEAPARPRLPESHQPPHTPQEQRLLDVATPLVSQCFSEMAYRYDMATVSAKVRFQVFPADAGREVKTELLDVNLDDPYFRACVEDALQEAPYPPQEDSPIIVEHDFRQAP